MKYLHKYLLVGILISTVLGCDDRIDETVESAYLLPLLPELNYKFSRNGESSVNTLECRFLKAPIDRIFSRYMNDASMGTQTNYDEAIKLYKEGEFGLKPREEIASSPTHQSNREKIVTDVDGWLQSSAQIAGLGLPDPLQHRGRPAVKGASGHSGNSITDFDICFVDDKGLAVAEVFKNALLGAVYLDKIVNKHLNVDLLKNEELMATHSNTQLLQGRNYTALEHHWDLAYGYYGFLKSLAQSEGLPALKGSDLKIYESFVRGRIYMQTGRYDEMRLQANTIRQELVHVVGARTMLSLVGDNTIANLKENPKNAFRFLSQAYGMLYTSMFASNAEGKPIISYDEMRIFLNALEKDGGLWDTERLLGDDLKEGSLLNIATKVGEKFGITLEEIRK